MPILNAQSFGQHKEEDGTLTPVAPSMVLQERGPCLQVTISVAKSVAEQLIQQGLSIPTPVTGLALIDTGATGTCIDQAIAESLGLPVVDVVTMASASHVVQQPVYPIQLDIAGLGITIDAPRATGVALSSQGLQVLIGRDLLQHCTLFYNGPTGQFTLSI